MQYMYVLKLFFAEKNMKVLINTQTSIWGKFSNITSQSNQELNYLLEIKMKNPNSVMNAHETIWVEKQNFWLFYSRHRIQTLGRFCFSFTNVKTI